MRRSPPYAPVALLLAWLAGSVLIAGQAPFTGAAVAEELSVALNPAQDYSADRAEAIRHQVDFRVVVTPPYHCQVLKVWLPLPQSDHAQQIGDSRLSTFPQQVEPQIAREEVYGNKFAYFEFHDPQGAQIIQHQFTATCWNLTWQVEPSKVAEVTDWPAGFSPYLKPQAISDEGAYARLLSQVVPQRAGPADLFRVMSWIDNNLTYDHVRASLKADANHAATLLRGHCSDYHGLCATMGRSLGYPTRVTYGLSLFPKNSPSHCKLETYLPPHGWVSYDLSETQKLVAAINQHDQLDSAEKARLTKAARDRLQRGFREHSWLLLTRGTDYQLAPKALAPVRVVRTIYAEADGRVLPDPDPANTEQTTYAWMTAHAYKSDKPFKNPFKDFSTLDQ